MATLTQQGRHRTGPSRFAERSTFGLMRDLVARVMRVSSFARELVLVLVAYFAYFAVRGLTQGSDQRAVDHAHKIVSLEKAGGFFWEPAIQARLVDHHWIVTVANWMYIWGHWPLIGVVAAWLFLRRRDTYRLFRNAFFISGAIGIVVFVLYPVAPPRLAGVDVVDTVSMYSNAYRVLQPPAFVNQYAALPSLHFGWDLLIGIALAREAKRIAFKAVGVIVPVMMLAAVVITANHYIFDAMAGAFVALLGLAISYSLQRYSGSSRKARRRPVRPTAGRVMLGRSACAR
jgi:hypothetical protein